MVDPARHHIEGNICSGLPCHIHQITHKLLKQKQFLFNPDV